MNVSISALVDDLDTSVTAIQGVITAYTLVMAAAMITGGKLGDLLGRRRALRIGLVVYACGSGLTAVAPNVDVLLLGWSVLEGLGAALIMPTVIALIAGNFTGRARAGAYGTIAAAAAVAIALGPDHRRLRDRLLQLAVGLRGGGRHRRRHPAGLADHPRRADRRAAAPGPRRRAPVRHGHGPARVRGAPVGELGLGAAPGCRRPRRDALAAWHLGGDLARRRRAAPAAGIRRLAAAPGRESGPRRSSTPRCSPTASSTWGCRCC